MDVTSLYTNIPQNEGIEIVCKAYEDFYKDNHPIPTHYLREMPRLIIKEKSFQFNGKHYLQTHGGMARLTRKKGGKAGFENPYWGPSTNAISKETSLTNCTGHPIMHITPNTNWGFRSCTSNAVVGFHMTSLKFKLQNYRSYRDFTFMVY